MVEEAEAVTPYHESDGQPKWCKLLVEAGCRFTYDPSTRFVNAEPPFGGKQCIAEIMQTGFPGFCADEYGRRLAAVLNGESEEDQ